MSAKPIRLSRLHCHRMPGVRRERGFELRELSPGINVVYGPNGSGKTTVALAVQRILWPSSAPDTSATLSATFATDDATWEADVEGAGVEWRRNGSESAAPQVGGADSRHRYRIALAELLSRTNDDSLFAREVRTAVVGGFDLEAIEREARLRDRPAGIQNVHREFDAARRHLDEVTREQMEIERREADDKPRLEGELEESTRALRLEKATEKALRYRKSRVRIEQLSEERRRLPVERLAHCHPNDLVSLDGIEQQIADRAAERDAREKEVERLTREIESLEVGEASIPRRTLDRLEELVEGMERIEGDRRRLRDSRPGLIATRGRLLAQLEPVLTPEQLERLADALALPEADELAHEAHALVAERSAIDSRRRGLLPQEETRPEDRRQAIRAGCGYLADWVGEPAAPGEAQGPAPHRAAILSLASIAVAAVAGLAVLHHPLWSVAALPVAWLAWLAARSRRKSAGSPDPRAIFRSKYERLDLEQPERWDVDGVVARLSGLCGELQQIETVVAAQEAHAELDKREQALASRSRDHDSRRVDVARRLGVELPRGNAWLPVFASSLSRWQAADLELAATDAQEADLARRAAGLSEESLELLRPFLTDPPRGRAALARTLTRLVELQRLLGDREHAQEEQKKRIEPALVKSRKQRRRFFADRGLEDGDRAGLEALLGEAGSLRELDHAIGEAEGAAKQDLKDLAEHPELRELPIDELETRRGTHARSAAGRDDIFAEITRIDAQIETVRSSYDVTDARSRLVAAEEALIRQRAEEAERAVGLEILQSIRGESEQRSLPDIFVRARKYLARITGGRFELRLPADTEGQFRAFDQVEGMEKSLEQLSAGERVQLLLSVRLGFLEHGEQLRPPLLLDETLGTSDDSRVRETLDAIIEVAREGRQVFYFTAQHDELGKWKARLEGQDVPCAFLDLAKIRGLAEANLTPLEIRAVEAPEVEAPAGRTHAEYGRALNVPGLDPTPGVASPVHLWHVIDDCEELYRLVHRGVSTIGQFRTLESHSPKALDSLPARLRARVSAGAAALERLFEMWRAGRSKSVELEQVLASGAVGPAFQDRVAELLVELDRDPTRLLEELEAGRLKRWQAGKTDQLRDAFDELGVLAAGEPLTDGELIAAVAASLERELDDGLFEMDWVRRIVGSLTAPDREGPAARSAGSHSQGRLTTGGPDLAPSRI